MPTAVFWAPAPSAMTSVAVAPEVETEASVPPEGTFVSVQGAVSVEAASVSEKVACTRSTLPFALTSCMTSVPATRIGLAPSAGAVAAKEERLPAASRMPLALVASATREGPDRGVGSPGAFGDDERGDRGGDRDGGERSSPRGRSRASTGSLRPSRPRATRRRWRGRGRPCRWSCCLASKARRGSVLRCPSSGRSTPAPTRRRSCSWPTPRS